MAESRKIAAYGVGAAIVVGAAGLTGRASGFTEYRSLKNDEDGWQIPITFHPEIFDEDFRESELPFASPAEVEGAARLLSVFATANAGVSAGMYCPDMNDQAELYFVTSGDTQVPLCIDLSTVASRQVSGMGWIAASPIYPAAAGEVPGDLVATFDNATPEQCMGIVGPMKELLESAIKEVDPDAGKSVRYQTQILISSEQSSRCDEPSFLPPSMYGQ